MARRGFLSNSVQHVVRLANNRNEADEILCYCCDLDTAKTIAGLLNLTATNRRNLYYAASTQQGADKDSVNAGIWSEYNLEDEEPNSEYCYQQYLKAFPRMRGK
jgi:hypothetical protein